ILCSYAQRTQEPLLRSFCPAARDALSFIGLAPNAACQKLTALRASTTSVSFRQPNAVLVAFLEIVGHAAFYLYGCDRSVCGSGHYLTQALDTNVSGGVHARNIGVHIIVCLDVASLVHIDDAFKRLAVGDGSDESEYTEH